MKNRIFSKMLFVGLMVFNSAVIYAAAAPEQAVAGFFALDIYAVTEPEFNSFSDDKRKMIIDTLIDGYMEGDVQRAFVVAAQKGLIWAFEPLLSRVASIDEQYLLIDQALYKAVTACHEDVVRFLLKKGANKNLSTYGYLSWHHAAEMGHVGIIKLFIEFGVDIDVLTGQFGSTALHIAAKEGHVEVLEYLVDSGARIDAVDLGGRSTLFSLLLCSKHNPGNVEKFYSGAKMLAQTYRAQLLQKYLSPTGKLTMTQGDIVRFCGDSKRLESLAYVFNELGGEIISYLGKEDISNLMNTGNTVFTKCALNEMPRRARLERLAEFINPAIQHLRDSEKKVVGFGIDSKEMKTFLKQLLEGYVPVQESAGVRPRQRRVNASGGNSLNFASVFKRFKRDEDPMRQDLARARALKISQEEELSQAAQLSQEACYEEDLRQAAQLSQQACYEEDLRQAAEASKACYAKDLRQAAEALKEMDKLSRAMKASEEMDMLGAKRAADHEELLNAKRKKEEEGHGASQASALIRRGDDEEERALLEALVNSRKENSTTEAQAGRADQDEDSFDCPSSSSEDEDC